MVKRTTHCSNAVDSLQTNGLMLRQIFDFGAPGNRLFQNLSAPARPRSPVAAATQRQLRSGTTLARVPPLMTPMLQVVSPSTSSTGHSTPANAFEHVQQLFNRRLALFRISGMRSAPVRAQIQPQRTLGRARQFVVRRFAVDQILRRRSSLI